MFGLLIIKKYMQSNGIFINTIASNCNRWQCARECFVAFFLACTQHTHTYFLSGIHGDSNARTLSVPELNFRFAVKIHCIYKSQLFTLNKSLMRSGEETVQMELLHWSDTSTDVMKYKINHFLRMTWLFCSHFLSLRWHFDTLHIKDTTTEEVDRRRLIDILPNIVCDLLKLLFKLKICFLCMCVWNVQIYRKKLATGNRCVGWNWNISYQHV